MQIEDVLNPISTIITSQIEASRHFADAMFNGALKIDHIIMDAAHDALSDQFALAKSMVHESDSARFAELQLKYFYCGPNTVLRCQEKIIRVVDDMCNDIKKSLQQEAGSVESQEILLFKKTMKKTHMELPIVSNIDEDKDEPDSINLLLPNNAAQSPRRTKNSQRQLPN